MPNYSYICKKCNNKESRFFHMKDDKPNVIACSKCNSPMKRDWTSDFGKNNIKIPFQWNDSQLNFDKSPSGKKHFY